MSLKLNGFYIEDKPSGHEHEIEEKNTEIEGLRELLAEERLGGEKMQQIIDLPDPILIDVDGEDYTKIQLSKGHLDGYSKLTLLMSNYTAEKILDKLSKRFTGKFPEEWEELVLKQERAIEERDSTIETLEELLAENRLEGSVF